MAEMCARAGALFAETRSPREIADVARVWKTAGIDVLAMSGGDGTGSHTLTHFAEVYGGQPLPTIAFVRGGTMNTVANGLGIRRGTPQELLKRLIGRCKAGRLETQGADVMIAAGREYCFLFGVGTLHAFLKAYYEAGQPHPTPLTAGRVLGRGIGAAFTGGDYAKQITARVKVGVQVDDETFATRDYFTIAAGTIDQIGLGFSPFHAKNRGDQGFFHVLGLTLTIPEFALALPRIWMKKPLPTAGWDRCAKVLTITGADESPLEYIVDGDLRRHHGELTVALGPRLTVALP